LRAVSAPLPTLRNKQHRNYPKRSPVVRCKQHAENLLKERGFKLKGVYWVESAGDSQMGQDTIGYVNAKGELRRALLEQDPKGGWKVQRTEEGW
jgi:hypothetical protein